VVNEGRKNVREQREKNFQKKHKHSTETLTHKKQKQRRNAAQNGSKDAKQSSLSFLHECLESLKGWWLCAFF